MGAGESGVSFGSTGPKLQQVQLAADPERRFAVHLQLLGVAVLDATPAVGAEGGTPNGAPVMHVQAGEIAALVLFCDSCFPRASPGRVVELATGGFKTSGSEGQVHVTKKNVQYSDPSYMLAWLEGALKKEKEKYEKCPIVPDMVPGYVNAQAWGYVVTGYFLAEQSFKALLNLRGKEVPKTHSLSDLFDLLDHNDQSVLREYYSDYKATIGDYRGAFPFDTLDDFLENLGDGLVWRYYLIEDVPKMPSISVDYLHEIVFGCNQVVNWVRNSRFEPTRYTRSWRMRWERLKKYNAWITVRMNSAGWDDLEDRLEILWGPDYLGRHDLYLFRGKGAKILFSKMPNDLELPVVDKRMAIEAFDVEEGYRSIGVTFP